MFNPYDGLDWQSIEYINSANHWHALAKDRLLGFLSSGLQHVAIANYLPAHPTYPLVGNEFFAITAEEIPEGIIASPNSEKVSFLDANMHISCMGSAYESDGSNWDSETPKLTWKAKFDLVFNELQYEDGGGIIINHPKRSNNTAAQIIEKLQYDTRVLGIEIYNHRAERDYGATGYYMDGWDTILSKGYQCFGFCSPDEHNLPSGYVAGADVRDSSFGLGRNVLLAPSRTEQEALKAYRNGSFYSAYYGDRIKFTRIECIGNKIYFETDLAEKIDLISYSLYGTNIIANPVISVNSNVAEFTMDNNMIFVRAVAHEDANTSITAQPITGEKLFSQPIMFKTPEKILYANPLINRNIDKKYAKADGAWREISKIYGKNRGVWRDFTNSIKTR